MRTWALIYYYKMREVPTCDLVRPDCMTLLSPFSSSVCATLSSSKQCISSYVCWLLKIKSDASNNGKASVSNVNQNLEIVFVMFTFLI